MLGGYCNPFGVSNVEREVIPVKSLKQEGDNMKTDNVFKTEGENATATADELIDRMAKPCPDCGYTLGAHNILCPKALQVMSGAKMDGNESCPECGGRFNTHSARCPIYQTELNKLTKQPDSKG